MFGSFQRCVSRLLSAGFVVFTVAMIIPSGLRGQDAISLSVSPLQDAEKDGATVIRDQGGEWVTLREGRERLCASPTIHRTTDSVQLVIISHSNRIWPEGVSCVSRVSMVLKMYKRDGERLLREH